MMFVGRLCGPSELGLFALAMTNWFFVLAFLESLITSPFTVFVHRLDNEKRTTFAGRAIMHVLALGVAATVFLALEAMLLNWLEYRQLAVVVAALAATVPFRLLGQFARRYHYASLDLDQAVVLDVSVAVLQLTALAAIYWYGFLTAAAACLAIGSAYALVLLVWLIRQRRSFRIRTERVYVDFLRNWALGRWLAASQISMMAGGQTLPWIIAFLLSESATGVYAACATLVCIGAPLLVAVQNVLGPRAALVFSESGLTGLRGVVRKTTISVVSLMGLFVALLVVFGDPLMRLSFGAEYTGYQGVVVFLALSELAYASMLGAYSGLMVLERSDLLFRSNLAGILVTLALAVVSIREFGLPGAAAAHFIGATVSAVIAIFYYGRVVRELDRDAQPMSAEQTGRWVAPLESDVGPCPEQL